MNFCFVSKLFLKVWNWQTKLSRGTLSENGSNNTKFLNPFTLRAPPESIVCYFHTLKNNLGIKRKFKKYLKESCCLTSGQHFSIKYFSQNAFCLKSNTKIVRPVSAALSVNGLMQPERTYSPSQYVHSWWSWHNKIQIPQFSTSSSIHGPIHLCILRGPTHFLKSIFPMY